MNRAIVLAVLLLGLAASSGCRVAQTTEIGAYSHFVLPGDKVQPLGPVKIKAPGRTLWGRLTLPTSDDQMKLFNLALNEYPEAGVVIDYVRTNTIYHLGILPIYWNRLELEGTAAKVIPQKPPETKAPKTASAK